LIIGYFIFGCFRQYSDPKHGDTAIGKAADGWGPHEIIYAKVGDKFIQGRLSKKKAFYVKGKKEYRAKEYIKIEGTIRGKDKGMPDDTLAIDQYFCVMVKHESNVFVPGKVKIGSRQCSYGYAGKIYYS
jgi:hypothetical protein